MKNSSLIRSMLVISILFFSSFLFGQGNITEPKNDFDERYTPTQNSIFNNLNKNNLKPHSYSSVEIKNAIKFCPTALFREKLSFAYQREVYKGLALNIGIAKAFGKDFLHQTYFSIFNSGSQGNVLSTSDISNYSAYSGSSPLLSAGLRLYYSGKSFDGGYVEFTMAHERIDFQLNAKIYDREVRGSRSGSFTMNAFFFGFGHTFVTGNKNNITHEIFFNGGIKLFDVTQFLRVDYTGPYGSPEAYYTATSQEFTTRILPAFNIGYSFGFGF